MVLPFRCDELDVQHLKPMGDLGQVVFYPDFDIRNTDMVKHAISRSNVVINLIGATKETWNYDFQEVHVDIPRRIAEAVAENSGVERFMHMSCLAATADAPSKRLRTKAEGDRLVREAVPSATIFKATHIVGPEDKFSNAFADLGKRSPMVALVGGGRNKIQPIYVRDVCDAMINSLKSYEPLGKDYCLAGPEVLTVREFVRVLQDTMREPFHPVTVPSTVAMAAGGFWDWVQKRAPPLPLSPLFHGDFAAEMTIDHVLPAGQQLLTAADLGVDPVSVLDGSPIEHIRHLRAGG